MFVKATSRPSRPAEAYTAANHHCTLSQQPKHTYVTDPARRGVCISCVRYTGVTSIQLLCICHPGAEAVGATLRASIILSYWLHTFEMLIMHAQPQGKSTAPQQFQPPVLMIRSGHMGQHTVCRVHVSSVCSH
jgi:hypothetical protein